MEQFLDLSETEYVFAVTNGSKKVVFSYTRFTQVYYSIESKVTKYIKLEIWSFSLSDGNKFVMLRFDNKVNQ